MQDKLIDTQWVDIVLPAAPESQLFLWGVLAITCVLIILMLVSLRLKRLPRRFLLHQLRRLEKRVQRAGDFRQILALLEGNLCRYHQLPYLFPARHVDRQWYTLFDNLTQCRYRKTAPSPEQTRGLLQHCRKLLSSSKNNATR